MRCRLAFSVSDLSNFRLSGEECAATSLLIVSRSMPQPRQNLCSRVVSAPQLGQCIKISEKELLNNTPAAEESFSG
jgi:hypothetical protein